MTNKKGSKEITTGGGKASKKTAASALTQGPKSDRMEVKSSPSGALHHRSPPVNPPKVTSPSKRNNKNKKNK